MVNAPVKRRFRCGKANLVLFNLVAQLRFFRTLRRGELLGLSNMSWSSTERRPKVSWYCCVESMVSFWFKAIVLIFEIGLACRRMEESWRSFVPTRETPFWQSSPLFTLRSRQPPQQQRAKKEFCCDDMFMPRRLYDFLYLYTMDCLLLIELFSICPLWRRVISQSSTLPVGNLRCTTYPI